MSEETTIYQDQTVHITNLRAVIEGKTYPIANITSVGSDIQTPSGLLPVVFILVGIMSLMVGISTLFNPRTWDNNYTAVIIGALMVTAGSLIMRNSKPIYNLQISTAAGEVKALQSTDRYYIKTITEAINQAIIQRG